MTREIVQTPDAPRAIGPYSQAVRAGELLFCSGQIALDPESGAIIEGDISHQAARVLRNLAAVLTAGGSSLGQVVKTTIYLADMADFAACNDVYARFFEGDPPARATVAVKGLPKGVLIEVDAIAVCDGR